ncbi:unnamed protein product [Hermetia illucens]|uniref:Myb/SANT-like DNA-binding domain-containing protein n=1 Tax=Hermetia illucens TaxID=343691 RepID=A0A7R8YLR5_HERIL|nr:uncharacterized protein LOC119660608 isoform X1 [Hermetia illucens]CAD7077808.1 unnamed protein product [Hermetia illucens]
MEPAPKNANGSQDSCYQISDDEMEENGQENENSSINEESEMNNSGRGSYERAWTTEATRALIHIRGPMEEQFSQGRHKRTTLWIMVTKQLQKLGYMYSAAKVQKKWHNILITYNKNINKKYQSGYVHWEFFEEMFKYLQGKKAQYDQPATPPIQQEEVNNHPLHHAFKFDDSIEIKPVTETNGYYHHSPYHMNQSHHQPPPAPQESKRMRYDPDQDDQPSFHGDLPLEITHENGSMDTDNSWWKDYFDRKLQVDREKVQLQREMHRDLMNFNKMTLIQQEKIERIKIDAINNLTTTLQKLVENKNKKC